MRKTNNCHWLWTTILLFLAGCTAVESSAIESENLNIEVFFCPEDDCSGLLVETINAAKQSLNCALHDLTLVDVIRAFEQKSNAVDTKIVIENNNADETVGALPNVKIAETNFLMHNKFCVVDSQLVFTGSMNPTHNGAFFNNNNILVIDSKIIANNFNDEFDELWNGEYGKGNAVHVPIVQDNGIVNSDDKLAIETYFCPEDCGKNQAQGLQRILEVISSAEESVQVAAFSFTHEAIADALLAADSRGVAVSVVIENRQRNVLGSQYQRLKDFGMNVSLDTNKNSMHHKFIIVDGKTVITGSPNFTKSAMLRNDENLLVIHNQKIAQLFVKKFEALPI